MYASILIPHPAATFSKNHKRIQKHTQCFVSNFETGAHYPAQPDSLSERHATHSRAPGAFKGPPLQRPRPRKYDERGPVRVYQRRSRRDRRRYAGAVRCWAVSQTGPGAGGSSSYNAIAFPSSGRKKIKINGGNLFVDDFEDFIRVR